MKLILAALTASALLTAPALAAPCRDAKGKFVKCTTAVQAKTTTTSKTVTRTRDGKCRDAKGHFAKC